MITLKKEKEFSKVYQKGQKKHTKYVIIIFLNNNLNEKRFGFVASKKTGNAVKRNRIKRLFREVVRLNYNKFKENYDYIPHKILSESNFPFFGKKMQVLSYMFGIY